MVEAEVIGGTPEVGSAKGDEDAVPVESELLEDDDVTEVSVDDGATEVGSELVERDDVTELAVDDGSVVVDGDDQPFISSSTRTSSSKLRI